MPIMFHNKIPYFNQFDPFAKRPCDLEHHEEEGRGRSPISEPNRSLQPFDRFNKLKRELSIVRNQFENGMESSELEYYFHGTFRQHLCNLLQGLDEDNIDNADFNSRHLLAQKIAIATLSLKQSEFLVDSINNYLDLHEQSKAFFKRSRMESYRVSSDTEQKYIPMKEKFLKALNARRLDDEELSHSSMKSNRELYKECVDLNKEPLHHYFARQQAERVAHHAIQSFPMHELPFAFPSINGPRISPNPLLDYEIIEQDFNTMLRQISDTLEKLETQQGMLEPHMLAYDATHRLHSRFAPEIAKLRTMENLLRQGMRAHGIAELETSEI